MRFVWDEDISPAIRIADDVTGTEIVLRLLPGSPLRQLLEQQQIFEDAFDKGKALAQAENESLSFPR